ncbi:hypothetical protein AB0G79_02655 [Streptomyces sp. NPDC020807]|uniref:hypothetical protein n=1 Tax=Streptomyces sp. NPDC020807 TaxID=3155119 RepID=UPI0033ECA28E
MSHDEYGGRDVPEEHDELSGRRMLNIGAGGEHDGGPGDSGDAGGTGDFGAAGGSTGSGGTGGFGASRGSGGSRGSTGSGDLGGLVGAIAGGTAGGGTGGTGGTGGGAGRGPGAGPGGEDDTELALRRLLHGAVAGLEPSGGSLEHLRRAVPARRARKRQAVVGAAAAAVLVGTAVPAFVHVANSGGTVTAHSVNAGHGEEAQGGTGADTGIEGGKATTPPAATVSPVQGSAPDGAEDTTGPRPTTTAPSTRVSTSKLPAFGDAVPCTPAQLAVASASAGGADATGTVYGAFRIANVSEESCVVNGSGLVGFEARGAADPGRIGIVAHTAGDGTALPDPTRESYATVLKPGGSYALKFAWVPSSTCPTTVTASPTPPPTTAPPTTPPTTPPPTTAPSTTPPSTAPTTEPPGTTEPSASTDAGTGTETSTGEGGGLAPQLLPGADDRAPSDGSVVVSHTAEPGGPVALVTVPHACAGTIFRTGLIAGS